MRVAGGKMPQALHTRKTARVNTVFLIAACVGAGIILAIVAPVLCNG